jgi:hypothetical protein
MQSNNPLPPIWTLEDLARDAQASLEAFVARRLGESADRFPSHLKERRKQLGRLIRLLSNFDPDNPDRELLNTIVFDVDLLAALRYVAGPPVSEDDLLVLVTRRPISLSRRLIEQEPELLDATIRLVCSLADLTRFPWVKAGRQPRWSELKLAIRSTAAMHAYQRLQTERRGYGKRVEAMFADKLVSMGYRKVKALNGGRVTAPMHFPHPREFYGECNVYGRKTDLFIGLSDGRVAAVEAKDSSSVVNSVKRVLNDTAAKAEHWHRHAGMTIVPIALLSGVFGVSDLQRAQTSGLFLVWLHDLLAIEDWLRALLPE